MFDILSSNVNNEYWFSMLSSNIDILWLTSIVNSNAKMMECDNFEDKLGKQ